MTSIRVPQEVSRLGLGNTPYLLNQESESVIADEIRALEERVDLLRGRGTLTETTIREYYGERRFEQVAESNAIEGNTLSVGETELAVVKGITITGHDPAFVRDAQALDRALQRLVEMARTSTEPTDLEQLLELHALILGDRQGGGIFRSEPIRISGSEHVPPQTWNEIMQYMEQWEKWSGDNPDLPAPVRCAVLHAWLAHIHPFVDGNGRAARAITNLELVRSGYPPIIIRKKERDRYIAALSESDEGGDIRSFFELILERVEGALTGLELSAKKQEGYSPVQEKIRKQQEQQLQIWDASVRLLAKSIEHYLYRRLGEVGGAEFVKVFDAPLDLEEYIQVCERRPAPRTWAFITNVMIPGFPKQERLAYVGHRSATMFHALDDVGGPSLFWSEKNPDGYPKWKSADENAPFAIELTTRQGVGDEWYARIDEDTVRQMNTTQVAKRIVDALVDMAAESR